MPWYNQLFNYGLASEHAMAEQTEVRLLVLSFVSLLLHLL
jgi:hypothetical protein